jgi:hypothetical protein
MSATPDPSPDAAAGTGPAAADFFERNVTERPEIIAGVIREGQIGVLGGTYGVGKTPLLADIIEHVLNGRTWLGQAVRGRPVISIDFETSGPVYKRNIRNIAARLGVASPRMPAELDAYLELDDQSEPGTAKLFAAMRGNRRSRLNLLEDALKPKPNALVVIDSPETLFGLDTAKRTEVQACYFELRELLCKHAGAAMLLSFNLRKKERKGTPPNLLTDPRAWLEEICGSIAILDRCDVRLGMDFYSGDEIKVINGVRRGEDMHPLLVRSVGDGPENYAGFELVLPTDLDLEQAFKPQQKAHWDKLPCEFGFEEIADKSVPRSSLSRLIAKAKSFGLLTYDEAIKRYRKLGPRC